MTTHSKAELKWLSGVAHLSGQCVVTPRSVLNIIDRGDRFFLSDGLIGSSKKWCVCEYDEDYYHKDLERDVKKTNKLFEQGAPRVVRLRRGCAPLRSLVVDENGHAHKNYTEVLVDTHNTYDQVAATAMALKLPMKPRREVENVIKIGELAFEKLSKRRENYYKQLVQVYGSVVADQIMNCRGVQKRLWNDDFRDGIAWLAELVTVEKLATAMCNSVAPRLHDEQFRKGVAWILEKGVPVEKLATIMCDSFAVRLHEREFRDGVDWLIEKGVPVEKLPTMMCNSLATNLHNAGFRRGVEWILDKGVPVEKLPTIMCGSLAARLHEDDFQRGVEWLIEKGVPVERLPTIMCNSLAANLHDEEFRRGVDWLIDKGVPVEKLPTIMCNSLAAHLHEMEFREAVDWLIDKGVPVEKLPTIMCNSLAAQLQDGAFREGIIWLIGQVTVDKLHTVLRNGVAKRLHQKDFRDAVESLSLHGFPIDKIVCLISRDQVAARLVHMKEALIREGRLITRDHALRLAKHYELQGCDLLSRKRARGWTVASQSV